MKVELEDSVRKSLLKGCLWMGESGVSLEEGGQDEASQQPKPPQLQGPAIKICNKEFPMFHHL